MASKLYGYLAAADGDPFKVRAAIDRLIIIHALDTDEDSMRAVDRMIRTRNALKVGVCDASVEVEWRQHLRSITWWRRWRERRNEFEWRIARYDERGAQAFAEVKRLH